MMGCMQLDLRRIWPFCWYSVLIVPLLLLLCVIIVCLVTRVITDIQSRYAVPDNKHEPPVTPYSLPYFGSVFSFLSDPGKIFLGSKWVTELRTPSFSLIAAKISEGKGLALLHSPWWWWEPNFMFLIPRRQQAWFLGSPETLPLSLS